MSKTFLIIQREYFTRIRKKSFIISTLLFPLLYLGLVFGTAYIGQKASSKLKIALVDSSGKFTQQKIDKVNAEDKSNTLILETTDVAQLANDFESRGYDAYAVIPQDIMIAATPQTIVVKSNRTLGLIAGVQSKLNNIWNDIKYEELGIDQEKRVALTGSKLIVLAENQQDKSADGTYAMIIGYAAGFLVYFILLIYGSQVMMGVMEEKTNRIAEVMVSSVKPFQLMLGKIVGIALVALTQFLLWIVFALVVFNATKIAGNTSPELAGAVASVQKFFTSFNMPLLLFLFAFYFLGGFFFYSSLYAAIGSAINEDVREAQSLSFPITLIIIFAIFLLTIAMNDPTSPIAVWASIIPFTSPIVMMARVAYGIPGTVTYGQLALSMTLLVASFLFMVWFAGKIYRTGILMYGKKPTWKEMLKWAMRK